VYPEEGEDGWGMARSFLKSQHVGLSIKQNVVVPSPKWVLKQRTNAVVSSCGPQIFALLTSYGPQIVSSTLSVLWLIVYTLVLIA
jgi:hypothetical protein